MKIYSRYNSKKVLLEIPGDTLVGANLAGADLSGADLSWAKLYGADLSEADLSGANLSGANLSRANLSGADLSEADLSEVINYTPIKVSQQETKHTMALSARYSPIYNKTGDIIGYLDINS